MKSDPRDPLSTADMVAAGTPPATPERSETAPSTVKKLEAVPHPDVRAHADEPSERPGALLPGEEGQHLRQRWDTIQTGFVDEPRRAVQDADGLVAQTMKRVAEVFADERSTLEKQWTKGENVSTEDLRVALKRYRSFFDRLLAA